MENRKDAQENQNEKVEADRIEQVKRELVHALQEAKESIMEGIIDLVQPMKSRGQEVAAITFDFEKLIAKDALKMLDAHMSDNAMTYTEEQKMAMLALACRDIEDNGGLDDVDIMAQIQGEDAVAASVIGGRYLAYVNARMNRIIEEAEKGSALLEGTMHLEKPIERKDEAGNVVETVKELKYNFRRMRGMKYVECLGASSRTKAGISYGAGIALFAEAVRSNQPIDKKELEKLPAADAIVAGLIGIGFFLQSRGEVLGRIRKRPRT